MPEVDNPVDAYSEFSYTGGARPTLRYRYDPAAGVSSDGGATAALLHGDFAELRLAACVLPAFVDGAGDAPRARFEYDETTGRVTTVAFPTPDNVNSPGPFGGLAARDPGWRGHGRSGRPGRRARAVGSRGQPRPRRRTTDPSAGDPGGGPRGTGGGRGNRRDDVRLHRRRAVARDLAARRRPGVAVLRGRGRGRGLRVGGPGKRRRGLGRAGPPRAARRDRARSGGDHPGGPGHGGLHRDRLDRELPERQPGRLRHRRREPGRSTCRCRRRPRRCGRSSGRRTSARGPSTTPTGGRRARPARGRRRRG